MKKRITVVGVGALGSHVVQFLRNIDAEIKVIDFDRVEQKNVLSQFHAKATVGKAKVVGLQQTMQFLYGMKIHGIPHKLTVENAAQLLVYNDLLIDCLDNAEARQIVQNIARTQAVPCVHGALAADGAFGRVVWDEHFIIDSEAGVGAATCENGEQLPFIAVVSSFLAHASREFLANAKKIGFQISPLGGAIRI